MLIECQTLEDKGEQSFLSPINIMPITTKDSINKQWLEANGQASMFGHDNLQFKTVNHPFFILNIP